MSHRGIPYNSEFSGMDPAPFGDVGPPPFGDYGPPEVEGLLGLDIEGLDNRMLVSRVASGMTFDVISAKHLALTRTLRKSPTYRTSYKVLQNSVLKQNRLQITHAVCLGLGSFTGMDFGGHSDPSYHDKVLGQLVAFEGWIDQLRKCFYGSKYSMSIVEDREK